MPKQNPIKNVHVHQVRTKHPWRSAYFWKAESTPQWVSRAWRLGGFKNWLREFPPIFQLLVIWWFEILRVLISTLPATNIAPENRPPQQEGSIPTIHF